MDMSDFLLSHPALFLLKILPKDVLRSRDLPSTTASGAMVERLDFPGTGLNDTGDSQSSVITHNSITITCFAGDNHTGSSKEELVMALMFNE